MLHDVKDLIYIHPDASLYDAIKMLIHNKIHRFGSHSSLHKKELTCKPIIPHTCYGVL